MYRRSFAARRAYADAGWQREVTECACFHLRLSIRPLGRSLRKILSAAISHLGLDYIKPVVSAV